MRYIVLTEFPRTGFQKIGVVDFSELPKTTSDNPAYTPQAYALALRDIAPFGCNVACAGSVRRNFYYVMIAHMRG
jgi:hypothetical protein